MSGLHVLEGWSVDPDLLPAIQKLYAYGPGDDRATGYLSDAGAEFLPDLLDRLEADLGTRYTVVAFQAYLDGSGCDWHADTPFDAQAILSLGVTRTFGVRRHGKQPTWVAVNHGDLVVMPSGFQDEHEHCVPIEDVRGERVSLVFRTVRS